jgi:pilus assembly protein CpaE
MPVPASSILLLERDPASADQVRSALSASGSLVTVMEDAAAVIAAAADHTLVIIDVTDPATNAADVCRDLRAQSALASIPILCICQTDDVEERVRFLEAGADDVMAKPFDARELEARVDTLAVRFITSRDLAPPVSNESMVSRPRSLVAVYSPKGGAGTTTLATNIATVMAERRPGRVAIIDLDLQFGQVATHLNVRPRQTLADLARDDQSRRDAELVRSYAALTKYGLAVFAAPSSPDLAETISVGHVEEFLTSICAAYESVIVDAGSYLDERSLTVLDRAEGVVIPIYPEIAALKTVHVLIDYLSATGSVVAKTSFILNNVFAREILKLRDVESGLGAKIALDLPYDPFLYQKAVNEGIPLVRGAVRTTIAERFAQIASLAFAEQGAPVLVGAAASVEERKQSGLFGRRH